VGNPGGLYPKFHQGQWLIVHLPNKTELIMANTNHFMDVAVRRDGTLYPVRAATIEEVKHYTSRLEKLIYNID